MNRRWRLVSIGAALVITAACDGGTPVPSAPSAAQSFLAGTWTGTITIEHEGDPTTSGPTTWTFDVVSGTNLQSFQATIRSQHPWLSMTTTVTSAITPSNTPPARISTQGNYPSPRGCIGSLLSVGMAEMTRIEAGFSGVHSSTLQHSTVR